MLRGRITLSIIGMMMRPAPADWQPPASLLHGCVQTRGYTEWHCAGLGPAMAPVVPKVVPSPPARLTGVPATLRTAAGQIESAMPYGDRREIGAARAAIEVALKQIDQSLARK